MCVTQKASAAVAVLATVAILAAPSAAQQSPAAKAAASAAGFQSGPLYAGPRLWLGNLNGAVALGGQVERGFTQPGKYGPGIIAGGVGVDWYSWSQGFGAFGEYKYSVVPVQLFGNYHFPIESNKKIDPYLGLALVYSHYSSSWSGSAAIPRGASASASTTAFAGQGGVRYFLNDKVALQGQIGFGYGTLGLGATWRF
jgi:hypothetical protein